MAALLILGLGWTGEFLAELLDTQETHLPYAATTRDGRNHTIPWTLGDQPSNVDVSLLPVAQTVLVTFPVLDPLMMKTLIDAYEHKAGKPSHWIILSSTRPFNSPGTNNRHTPLDRSQDPGRIPAEDVILAKQGTVLHLAGLWGKQRQPKGWLSYFTTIQALKNKIMERQLHLIHGKDVARAIVATHLGMKDKLKGQRWLVTDGGFYDWLKLFSRWASRDQIDGLQCLLDHDDDVQNKWGRGQTVDGLIEKGGLKPRLDSDEFWQSFSLVPREFLSIE
ncbi:hypothetical protein BC941DRAFT_396177 [Chlamydoabsidia padenii]|nr:hypothetical protein BC941DRAFT_396177 [Chlamydoabsidia padenii]